MFKMQFSILTITFLLLMGSFNAFAKREINLTLDNAVDIAINNSFRTKLLQLQIERSMWWLKAREARLRTQVSMRVKTPDLQRISENKWNSVLYRDEIVRTNTELWQSDLSVRQPVMLLGYPTNGYLSLNYKLYRYTQRDDGDLETDFYNRLYVKFEQPFFLPNELKNDLESAQLNLKRIRLDYVQNRMRIIDDISDDYYDLFRLAYYKELYQKKLDALEQILGIASDIVSADSSRQIENTQLELELSNVQEELLTNISTTRYRTSLIKQRLRIDLEDSIYVNPFINLEPIDVDFNKALKYGYKNSAHLQRLNINKRYAEIEVEDQKGRNAFHMTLEMTYGLEKMNQEITTLWDQFDNSNSVTLNAYIPLWDGGGRNARIQAEMAQLRRNELQIMEEQTDIENDVTNAFTNMNEYYGRSKNMQNSINLAMEITLQGIEQYQKKIITLQDLLQIIKRHQDTEINFINAYLGYRRALLSLMRITFYDFEKDISVLDAFNMSYGE
jgi:outer membrane protein